MESILPLDVLPIGNESEKVQWFNLLRLSLSISICESIYPSLCFVIPPLLPPWRLALFPSSHADFLSIAFFSPSIPPSLSVSLSLFFISPCLLLPPLSLPCLGSAAALGAEGLWLGQKRTGCKTETNSELGHHCFCVRARSADEKLEDKRSKRCSIQHREP